jgi:dTDP-4-amino-4,6-dideoxygalactose transaminase
VHDESEAKAVAEVARSGKWWRCAYGDSELESKEADHIEGRSRVEVFEERFARAHGARYAVAVTSGTAALEIALRAAGIQPGDEVITTPYTFIATSSSIMNQLAVPVYTDIDPHSYNLDAGHIERLITERTRAILPVHFSGNLCDMAQIMAVAEKHGLVVIEDAAHAHGVELEGSQYAGTLGDMGCFSFQASKNLATGEGGMLLTDNERHYASAFSLHHLGRLPGEVWYKHFHQGWNYRMNEFTAAIGLVQLDRLFAQNARRMENARYLTAALAEMPGITPCRNHPGLTKHSHHLQMLRYDADAAGGVPREDVIAALIAEGIPCLAGYTFPNYANPFMNCEETRARYAAAGITLPDYAAYAERCPNCERACYREAVWLEHRLLLGDRRDMDDIIAAFAKVLG